VPPSAIDSRAQDGKPTPDRFLHRWTVADAMAAHRPIVLVFASPTYCTSQFCGPTVSEVARLYKTYSGKAAFIDVEIYRRHSSNASEVNKTALDWLFRNDDLTDPWLFLFGSDGVLDQRWGPIFDVPTVEKWLASQPTA